MIDENKFSFVIGLIVVAGTMIAISGATTQVYAQVPIGCTGNPHDRDSGSTGNPHDPSGTTAGGFEGGNPHDVGGFHDQHEHDSCPGAK